MDMNINAADVNAAMNTGATPICIASRNGRLQDGEILLAAGPADEYGATSILDASRQGYYQVENTSLAAGADQNAAGRTALDIAAQSDHHYDVKCCLQLVLTKILLLMLVSLLILFQRILDIIE